MSPKVASPAPAPSCHPPPSGGISMSHPVALPVYFSSEAVRPHPKAWPRKMNMKGKKRRSTAILTDTPQKEALAKKRLEERKVKKCVKRSKKLKKILPGSESEEEFFKIKGSLV
ncbi:hypothetical protein ATANTOWER_007074 [Ataeniobius toweri]|uniref:Uncharacterized protein n=1 Tax=Ataeniobius toweri TaxID=208326 RepID=A0ABU7B5R0_9TELE|nr:hypothetical protein [Ataeniobius toweri]